MTMPQRAHVGPVAFGEDRGNEYVVDEPAYEEEAGAPSSTNRSAAMILATC